MTTQKEAIVSPGPKVEIVDSKIPEPEPEQVVIKIVVSGMNPKDWYCYCLRFPLSTMLLLSSTTIPRSSCFFPIFFLYLEANG